MSATTQYETFFFESYEFDTATTTATFRYSFDGTRQFSETVRFETVEVDVHKDVLDRCLELALFIVGTSYYKTFPTKNIVYRDKAFSPMQAELINHVYSEGLGQFVFENNLTPDVLARVEGSTDDPTPLPYKGEGIVSLQSGGKDSLLLGELLNEQKQRYTALYMTSSRTYPKVIQRLNSSKLRLMHRQLDKAGLDTATRDGGLNGHVPVTYIVLAYALIDAVLHGDTVVLAAIGKEGEEPHTMVDGLPVNHQWSKTWPAEELFSQYVTTLIAPTLKVGSPLRPYSELRIAELFEQVCWEDYANTFSSCNIANYEQGQLNTELKWCGKCPKCANTFLLFSPFVIPYELRRIFDGSDLYASEHPKVLKAFRGLLDIDGEMKPFECVGEVDELRTAYHMGQKRYGDIAYHLPFTVPEGHFDYQALGPAPEWTQAYLPERLRKKVY